MNPPASSNERFASSNAIEIVDPSKELRILFDTPCGISTSLGRSVGLCVYKHCYYIRIKQSNSLKGRSILMAGIKVLIDGIKHASPVRDSGKA